MGSATVMDLVYSEVEEIVIADYNFEGAKQVADQYRKRKSKVSAQFVDANNHDGLVKVIKDADVAVSTIAPYYLYGLKVLKAAIDAGVNFADVSADFDITREMLALNDQAKRAGMTAITGMGTSPGLTNLLAKYGADKLDRVDEIHMAWADGPESPVGPATTYDWFHCITGMVPTYRDGKWVDVPAGSEPEIVDFPPKIEVFHVGHAEAVTVPRYIKGLKVVTIKGVVTPLYFSWLSFYLANFGFTSKKTLRVKDVSITPMDFTVALLDEMPEHATMTLSRILEEEPIARGLRVDVIGEKDGETTRFIYRLVPAEGATAVPPEPTSTSFSIGAQMLARGDIKAKGVFAPEGCVPVEAFRAELRKRGIDFHETAEKAHTK